MSENLSWQETTSPQTWGDDKAALFSSVTYQLSPDGNNYYYYGSEGWEMTQVDTAANSTEFLNTKLQEYISELDFKSIDEGRTILSKYKQKIREIKSRIKNFQIKDRNDEIAAKKAEDTIHLSLGNNGFLLRNGQEAATNVAWPPTNTNAPKNVQIDVKFVK